MEPRLTKSSSFSNPRSYDSELEKAKAADTTDNNNHLPLPPAVATNGSRRRGRGHKETFSKMGGVYESSRIKQLKDIIKNAEDRGDSGATDAAHVCRMDVD